MGGSSPAPGLLARPSVVLAEALAAVSAVEVGEGVGAGKGEELPWHLAAPRHAWAAW